MDDGKKEYLIKTIYIWEFTNIPSYSSYYKQLAIDGEFKV